MPVTSMMAGLPIARMICVGESVGERRETRQSGGEEPSVTSSWVECGPGPGSKGNSLSSAMHGIKYDQAED